MWGARIRMGGTLRAAVAAIALSCVGAAATPVHAEEHKEDKAPSPYIKLDDLNVTIFGDRRVRGIMTVTLSLEVAEPAKHDDVTQRQPILRDAYFRSVSRYAGSRVDLRRPVNIAQLGAILQNATDKVLGANVAKVLISSAAIRPM
jgi:flagellar basal body-associated protein FliL